MANNPQNPNYVVWDQNDVNSTLPSTNVYLPNDTIQSAGTNYLYRQNSLLLDFIVKNGIPSYQNFVDGSSYTKGSLVKYYEELYVTIIDNVNVPPLDGSFLPNSAHWMSLKDLHKTPLYLDTISDQSTYTLLTVKSYLGNGVLALIDKDILAIDIKGINLDYPFKPLVKIKVDNLTEVNLVNFNVNDLVSNEMVITYNQSLDVFTSLSANPTKLYVCSDNSTSAGTIKLSNNIIRKLHVGVTLRFSPNYNIEITSNTDIVFVELNGDTSNLEPLSRKDGSPLFGSELQKFIYCDIMYDGTTFRVQNTTKDDLRIGDIIMDDPTKLTIEEQKGVVSFSDTANDITSLLSDSQKSAIQKLSYKDVFFDANQLVNNVFVTLNNVYNRYFRGGDYGAMGSSGLPDITGFLTNRTPNIQSVSGAFKLTGGSFTGAGTGSANSNVSFEFRASNSNNIYGKTTSTVEVDNIQKPIYLWVGLKNDITSSATEPTEPIEPPEPEGGQPEENP